ncbi:hypothetical protein [Endozoicomonas sp. 8E]|uniref:hypothetical protein n=1 Tax=Endozoicomonas sp. 8E TaxID=3035692 RepID=UPI0029394485|nr:hypothetical protein [Endozoicomonas sp. 8E]WOG28973.1 hypothetical protein P6910_04730 [Endozoicomonas sp. 8E]
MYYFFFLLFLAVVSAVKASPDQCEKGYLILKLSETTRQEIIQQGNKSENKIYLEDHQGSRIDLHHIQQLPEELSTDFFEDRYMDIDFVSEINSAYGGDCIFFSFDLPENLYLTGFFGPFPIFNRIKHECLRCSLFAGLSDDLCWATGRWFGFTKESGDFLSLILPRYEIKWKRKNNEVLRELLLLPPDKNKGFPGGMEYLKAKAHFESYQK